MNNELTTLLTSAVSSTIAATVAWFFSRRKYTSEVNSSELENVKQAISIWKEMAIDLKAQLDETKLELEETRATLRDVNKRLREIEKHSK